jgi:hypothetical protein
MIFLIQYSRRPGRIEQFKIYNDSDRLVAENDRLRIELDLNSRKIDHEVVLLEAASQEALRKTHRRYFENTFQISSTSTG